MKSAARRGQILAMLASYVISAAIARGQQAPPSGADPPGQGQHPSTYVMGPDDEISILALDAEEINNRPVRIDADGNFNLPILGRVHAGGLTLAQLEAEVGKRLRKYIRQPEVAVNITSFRSQPVSVIGSVGQPGVHQLEGHKTLIEMLAKAGGLRNDAGYSLKITRKSDWGPLPLRGCRVDDAGKFYIGEVHLRDIIDARDPGQNIQIMPYDVISVPKADLVYVMGEVKKAGGYVLNDKAGVSVLQALAMAEGLVPTAAPGNSRIIRVVPGSNRIEISVNLKDVLAGKKPDLMLQPDDILFVPNSSTKTALRRTLDTTVQTLTGIIIYRRY